MPPNKNPPCNRQRQCDIIRVAKGLKELILRGQLESCSIVETTAFLLGISPRTVSTYWNTDPGSLTTPGKKRSRKSTKWGKVDEFGQGLVRRIVYGIYDSGEHITLDSIHSAIMESGGTGFAGSRATLRRLLNDLGFTWQSSDSRRALLEDPGIVTRRIEFLRQYHSLKEQGFHLVFLDETWFFSKGCPAKTWQDRSTSTCKRKTLDEGKRFIVLHAGSRNGFVNGAQMVFASASKSGDYHGNMNGEMFEEWLLTKLLPALEEPSVVVLDNASYHSVQNEKLPCSSWTKAELKTWLTVNNVPHRPDGLKRELLGIALQHKPQKLYKVDQIINQAGHQVLRLPPYHCHYNPIEMVWSECKRYYVAHAGRGKHFNDEAVMSIWQEAIQKVTPEKWNNYVSRVDNLISEDWSQEVDWDSRVVIEPIIIHIGDDYEDDDAYDPNELSSDNFKPLSVTLESDSEEPLAIPLDDSIAEDDVEPFSGFVFTEAASMSTPFH